MNWREFNSYKVVIIGVLVSIIIGLTSFVLDGDRANSIFITLMSALITLGIDTVTRLRGLEGKITAPGLEIVSPRRTRYQSEFLRLKQEAKVNLDILGIGLNGAIEDFLKNQSLISNVFSGLHIRLLILDPRSSFVSQRAKEDGENNEVLEKRIQRSVAKTVHLLKILNNALDGARSSGIIDQRHLGSFEVRLYQYCPYIAVFRADTNLLLGLYLSTGVGFNHAMINVPGDEEETFSQIKNHFNEVWRENIRTSLFMYNRHVDRTNVNNALFKELLGDDWMNVKI